jgi:hypothetical protein
MGKWHEGRRGVNCLKNDIEPLKIQVDVRSWICWYQMMRRGVGFKICCIVKVVDFD